MQIDKVAIDSVVQDPKNKRVRTDRNYMALRESLQRFGQQIPIVIGDDRVIMKGNGTWQVAKELGWTHIWVHYSHLNGTEAELFAIADNRIAELSEWDYEQLSLKMQNDTGQFADELLKFGWTSQELQPLRFANWNPDKIDTLDPPRDDSEPPSHSLFYGFTEADLVVLGGAARQWRKYHPSAEEYTDEQCLVALARAYERVPKCL